MSTTPAFIPEEKQEPVALAPESSPVEAKAEPATHTPAPWEAEPWLDFELDSQGRHYLTITGAPGLYLTGYLSPADAALIIAAPILLQALQNLLDGNSKLTVIESIRFGRDAITKATTPIPVQEVALAAPAPTPEEPELADALPPEQPPVIEPAPAEPLAPINYAALFIQDEPLIIEPAPSEPPTPIERVIEDDDKPF